MPVFLFLTFMVKSVKPIVPVEAFLDRYFIACLPTMSLVIVYALYELLPLSIVGELNRRGVLISLTAGLSVVMLLITALPMPKSIERFYTPLQQIHDHPIAKTFEFQHLIASAIEENIPILSVDTRKPLDTANRVFLMTRKRVDGLVPLVEWKSRTMLYTTSMVSEMSLLPLMFRRETRTFYGVIVSTSI